MIDPMLLALLACPACKTPVRQQGQYLACDSCKRKFPVENDVPVMLLDAAQTQACRANKQNQHE